MGWTSNPVYVGVDLASRPDKTIVAAYKDGEFVAHVDAVTTAHVIAASKMLKSNDKHNPFDPDRKKLNKVPTHDPYTNPDAYVYYSCDCGEVFDPGTKSFAALNNAAQHTGWVIKWGAMYYEATCPKCSKVLAIDD